MSVVLYSYFRSSAAYRVRIALNLKDVEYQIRPVHLIEDGGEHRQEDYCRLNPQGLVPTLVIGTTVLAQSSAIIEYLEEVYPNPALLPDSAEDRAYIRQLAQIIACDIHPLNNLRVLNFLKSTMEDYSDTKIWYRYWVHEGLQAFESLLEKHRSSGRFCFGDKVGMADVFLIPQIYNAKRFQCELAMFPLIQSIYENCRNIEAFSNAAPENQLDASTRPPVSVGEKACT